MRTPPATRSLHQRRKGIPVSRIVPRYACTVSRAQCNVCDMRRKDNAMLNVTEKAVMLLKAAKAARGAADAGIRIQRGVDPNQSGMLTIGITISEFPEPRDEEMELEGLRIYVEDALVAPLDGRTLDVRNADEGPELIFR